MTELTLTADQENAFHRVCQLITSPSERILVIEGYAGTGKTTLVKHILEHLPKLFKTVLMIDPNYKAPDVHLTATTNKAVEALREIAGESVRTIHSLLGLRIHTNYQTGETRLVRGKSAEDLENCLIVIDEASFIDHALLKHIFSSTNKCKLLFIGDPAQLTNPKTVGTPVFDRDYPKVKLSHVMRQAQGNPILDLATAFRNTVSSGEFFSFKPDGHYIQHLPRDQFEQAVCKEFNRPDWKHTDSRILAWTNTTVTTYNAALRELISGNPEFRPGDYAICNSFVLGGKPSHSVRTDEVVQITGITSKYCTDTGVKGWTVTVSTSNHHFFLPEHFSDKKRAEKTAKAQENYRLVQTIKENWIDLRAAYSCTVNKSQGSTYDKVFIDLDDIGRCNNGNQIARMLYVAVSRAREHVIFTGDLV